VVAGNAEPQLGISLGPSWGSAFPAYLIVKIIWVYPKLDKAANVSTGMQYIPYDYFCDCSQLT
jgi:hypothetical protein